MANLPIRNLIVVSDTHCGCRLGLCPDQITLDDNVTYQSSPLQQIVFSYWKHFHEEWVPMVTKGEPYILVLNGDCLEGVHHNAVTQISQNLTDQRKIAEECLSIAINRPNCAGYYHIRGTEAHAGKSGQDEEQIARTLGAIPDEDGRYARWELWLRLERHNSLIHITHHVGTTNSAAYESTAVHKELVEAYSEAGRWGDQPPDVVVRSHRHRYFEERIPTKRGYGISVVTPGWQLKTPNVFRGSLGRSGPPHFGGIILREGDEDDIYCRSKIWRVSRPKEERVSEWINRGANPEDIKEELIGACE